MLQIQNKAQGFLTSRLQECIGLGNSSERRYYAQAALFNVGKKY